MTTAAIKERLYDYISGADDDQLKAIYEIFEGQMTSTADWSDDEAFVAELNERVRRFETGIDRGYSWDELEASINELKKQRAGK